MIETRKRKALKRKVLEEEGFSTGGTVIALLLTLSLIFSAAQVYEINSTAADIQNVSDAAVLAAQNEVAEFYIVAQFCDAIVLSLSLTSIAATGLGVAALCTPATATFSKTLLKAGSDLIKSRNSFAEKAASSLNTLQKLLPYQSAAAAAVVVEKNSGGARGAEYIGLALLVPFEGKEITVGSLQAASELADYVESHKDEIEEAGKRAEDLAEKASGEKLRAFLHDCGYSPDYCMYERAASLSSISERDNPLYHTIDTWSFDVALKRAQVYYPLRWEEESPEGTSLESQVDSALRKRFYAYATEEIAKGFVREDATGAFEALFPRMPKNTAELRETRLYSEETYPITHDNVGNEVIHAWEGCSGIASGSLIGYSSLKYLDTTPSAICSVCQFTSASLGKVAAASSSIENGFEYHYRIVADAAEAYQEARSQYAPEAGKAKELVNGAFEKIKDIASEAIAYRIDAAPPGRYGAIAFVVKKPSGQSSSRFLTSFVSRSGALGFQVSLSAATLVAEASAESNTVISSLLDSIKGDSDDFGVGSLGIVLDLWSSLLFAYSQGQEALSQGIEQAIDAIPFASESGLGTWAAAGFNDLMSALGFEPAKLDALKPVLLNSAHVLSSDESAFSSTLIGMKKRYLSSGDTGEGSLFSVALSEVEAAALEYVEVAAEKIVIASIELFGKEGPSIPLTIALPPALTNIATDAISRAFDSFRNLESTITGIRRWE